LGLQGPAIGSTINRNAQATGILNLSGGGGTIISGVDLGQVDLGDNENSLNSLFTGKTGVTDHTFELASFAGAQAGTGHITALRGEVVSAYRNLAY